MRLPTIDLDSWCLRSAEKSHEAKPDTFWIPTKEQRRNLRVGQAAKLIFDISTVAKDGAVSGERMWVIVSECVADGYVGILDNESVSCRQNSAFYLRRGAEVPFLPEHVIEIADPPTKHARHVLAGPKSRMWPRD